jgi:CDP-glucose 4,6-dehydratase
LEALKFSEYWNGRRVFITGHTGFKGSWLTLLLSSFGARIAGYSIGPPTSPSLFKQIRGDELCSDTLGDIRDMARISEEVARFDPEFIFHLAAQPIVLDARENGIETVDINVTGTACVLESARRAKSLRAVISVTTDKVYRNTEWAWPFRETDALGGYEPYGASKACAEIVTEAWARSFLEPSGVRVGTVRAGNVIGGGDWARARLIPDAIRAWQTRSPLVIRSPASIRPWQHVLEPLVGYVCFAQMLAENPLSLPRALNFGPGEADAQSVEAICLHVNRVLPESISVIHSAANASTESKVLRIDSSLAAATLGWKPRLTLERAIELTVQWYVDVASGHDPRGCCLRQVADFQTID